MRPDYLPRGKKLALALLTPYIKNKVRTIQPQIFEKIENSQHDLKFTGSYEKKNVVNFEDAKTCYIVHNTLLYQRTFPLSLAFSEINYIK